MAGRRLSALAMLLLAGCAAIGDAARLAEERLEKRCLALGFAPEGEGLRLCRLLLELDARIARVERRLQAMEFELRRLETELNAP